MMRRQFASSACLVVVALLGTAACSRGSAPEPPIVDQATYQQEYAAWREEQQQRIAESLPIVGIWPLNEGETAFGTDRALPIVLPDGAAAARGGVLRRTGDAITIVPADGVSLRGGDGNPAVAGAELPVVVGSIELSPAGGGDGTVFVMARDLAHPAAKTPPVPPAFALDQRWRVTARFDAFATPRIITIADVRGGMMEMSAPGELVFQLEGRERRLVVFDGGEQFFLMFKDATNGATTYGGYRILAPQAVANGEHTVIDFNFAFNPPCAYSSFTTCPLPPRENTLDVAVEAGLKQLPDVKGWSEG